MIGLLANFHLMLPEVILLITAVMTLLAGLFLHDSFKSVCLTIALIGLGLAALSSGLLLGNYRTLLLQGAFVSDDMAQLMKLFIEIAVFLTFVYSKTFIEERNINVADFYTLGLFSTLGMMILVSAYSLLTLYLGLELLSLPLYAMTAISRTNNNVEAGLKYFIMGAIASGIMLYGLSLIYGATGKLELGEIALSISHGASSYLLLSFALVFILVGIGFKLAVVPFHMWAPDVYQGASNPVALFISTAPKIAAMAMAIRLLSIGLVDLINQWQQLLIVISLISTGLGNLLAISQTNIKRLFAYSAISHMGYALFGIVAGTNQGYAAALYYTLVYTLMTAAAFGLLILMSSKTKEIEYIEDLKGLNKRHPWLAFMMLVVIFSMAGIPPTVGFFTKLLVLKALVDVHLLWIAVLGLMFAVLGAYYYLSIIKTMYFEEPVNYDDLAVAPANTVIFSVNCLSLLVLGIFPSYLINFCVNAFQ